MTVTNTTARVAYTGTATIGQTMSITFPFYDDTDILVVEKVTATDAESTKTLTTNYTLSGGSGSTGTLTTIAAVSASNTWTIYRRTALTQSTDYIENDGFPADSHETGLDRLAITLQDMQEQLDRCLKFPVSEATSMDPEIADATARADTYAAFGSDGTLTFSALTTATASVSTYGQTLIDDTTAAIARTTLDLLQGTGANRPAAGTAGRRFMSTDYYQEFYDNGTDWIETSAPRPNLILNGGMQINQRVGPYDGGSDYPNNNDAYCLDHVLILSENNDGVDITQQTNTAQTANPFRKFLRANVQTANEKFGFLFPVENARGASVTVVDSTVSVSFYARSALLGNLRAHLLSWDGTSDSITSDVVNAWSVEGTNPTFVSNWTAENVAADLALTSSWVRYKVEGIARDTASTNNIALFIHIDDTDASASDLLDISGVMVNEGSLCSDFHQPPFEQELAQCQRYFRKSFDYAVEPVKNGSTAGAITAIIQAASTTADGAQVTFPFPMFKAPTVFYYSTGEVTTAWWNVESTAQAGGASSTINAGTNGFFIGNAGIANDAASDQVEIGYSAEAEM